MSMALLEERLVKHGDISGEEITAARGESRRKRIALDEALVSLGFVSREKLGDTLSQACELPYVPLASASPTRAALEVLSPKCARGWGVFPVAYDTERRKLTVAVSDPGQTARLERLRKFFMQQHTLMFQIAPSAEIEEALGTHFAVTGARTPGAKQAQAGQKPEPAAGAVAPAKQKLPDLPAQTAAQPAREAIPEPAGTTPSRYQPITEWPYADMSLALISAATAFARHHLRDTPERCTQIAERVRYCRLLASRLGLPTVQTDGVVLAAWLSALEDEPELVRQIVTPYGVVEILFPAEQNGNGRLVESQVFRLVKAYQALKDADPDAATDVARTRGQLRLSWEGSPQQEEVLESFFKVLVDEEFLSRLGHAAVKLVVVDPDEVAARELATALRDRGYDVEAVPKPLPPSELLAAFQPDLVIAGTDHSPDAAPRFCRQMREARNGKPVPLIVLSADSDAALAADCLRAGADECLSKPVNIELLLLKAERLIGTPAPDNAQTGVNGQEGVNGALRDMAFTDMIQILAAGARNMKITLTRDSEEGHVYLERGEVVHADAGELSGEHAFYELMQWQDGEFTIGQCEEFPESTVRAQAMSLLMNGARIRDEQETG